MHPFLIPQTSYNLKLFLEKAIALCNAAGCQAMAIVSDNAANITKAIQATEPIALNCFAHSGELLVKNFASIWPMVFDRAESLEAFFRLSAFPRSFATKQNWTEPMNWDVGFWYDQWKPDGGAKPIAFTQSWQTET